jgi:hypothetical protein
MKKSRVELSGGIEAYLSKGGKISKAPASLQNWDQKWKREEPLIVGRKNHPFVIGHRTSNHLTRFDLDTLAKLEADKRKKKHHSKR